MPGVRLHSIISLGGITVTRYYYLMIKTFACPEAEKIAKGQRSHKLPSDILVARRKLSYLKNAKTLQDLRIPPANRLEALQGDRRGQYSIRINDQWRICFVWRDGDAYNVEIVDYH